MVISIFTAHQQDEISIDGMETQEGTSIEVCFGFVEKFECGGEMSCSESRYGYATSIYPWLNVALSRTTDVVACPSHGRVKIGPDTGEKTCHRWSVMMSRSTG
jgi:hypothetical protein